MYSKEVEKILRGIEVGDRIKITKGADTYEGILLPRIESGDKSTIVIKLDNGYNIGMKYEPKIKVKLVSKGKQIKFKSAEATFKKDPSKPSISILGCGGTIASRVEYTTGAVSPAFSPDDLVTTFPELKEIANIDGRKLFDIFSEDMTAEHWKIIANEIAKELKSKTDGVVLTHGTDTMHYTSAALSFMLQNLPVPVVLVGAQRSSDRGSSDNHVNLICSALSAAKSDIAEVSVCMHGNTNDDFCYLHQGTKVRKLHTSRRDAFQSVNVLPFAKILFANRKIEYLRSDYKKRNEGKLVVDDKINPNVGMIYTHPEIKPEQIESMKKLYDGVVIAGTGLGHVPTNPSNDKFTKSLVPSIKSLIDSDVPVVIAPETIFGRIDMNVYTAGRILKETGVIGDGADWLPETALVKLMWVLGHTKKMDKIREMMNTDIAGEISSETNPKAFLE